MKRKKNKLSLALFSLRAFVGKISVSLYTPQCNFLTTYTLRFGTSKLLFQVLEEFHFFFGLFFLVIQVPSGTFFPHPLPTLKRLENNKRILKTPIIIDVFFFYYVFIVPKDCHFQQPLCEETRRFPSQIFLSGSVRPCLSCGWKGIVGIFVLALNLPNWCWECKSNPIIGNVGLQPLWGKILETLMVI